MAMSESASYHVRKAAALLDEVTATDTTTTSDRLVMLATAHASIAIALSTMDNMEYSRPPGVVIKDLGSRPCPRANANSIHEAHYYETATTLPDSRYYCRGIPMR